MPIKNYLDDQPIQLYIITSLSIIYLILQLALSHITHSLTLEFASYHMVCKIIALIGRIIQLRHAKAVNHIIISDNSHTTSTTISPIPTKTDEKINSELHNNSVINNSINGKINDNSKFETEEKKFIENSKILSVSQKEREEHEKKLKNTFGWTRINVLIMSIIFIVLASLSFSNIVEAIQTLVHMHHKDTTHYPLPLLTYGAIGLLLDGLCYFLIGGYTIHLVNFCKSKNRSSHNSFICDDNKIENIKNDIDLTNSLSTTITTVYPNIVTTTTNALKKDTNNLNSENFINNNEGNNLDDFNDDDLISTCDSNKRQGCYEIITDILSPTFVMICGLSVHLFETYCNSYYGKYIDPILAILSSFILLAMMSSYMKESCMILLQTIPGNINMEKFRKDLLKKFNEISVHDLHIWSLTSENYVSTVHIIFKNPCMYSNTIQEIKNYFYEQGIKTIAIQPEFLCIENQSSEIHNAVETTTTTKPTLSTKEKCNSLCSDCLVPCLSKECAKKSCCEMYSDLTEVIADSTLSNSCCQQNSCNKMNGNIKLSKSESLSTPPISVTQTQPLEILSVNRLENNLLKSSHIENFNDKKNFEIKNEECK